MDFSRERANTEYIQWFTGGVRNSPSRYYVSPYVMVKTEVEWGNPIRADVLRSLVWSILNSDDGVAASVSNLCLDKVYDTLQQAEDLRVAWAERGKALDLVCDSLTYLIRTYKALRHPSPKMVRQILGYNPGWKDVIKKPAGAWLAWNFGVKPTISDLHKTLGIFTDALPPIRVSESASLPYYTDLYEGAWEEGFRLGGKFSARMGCKVTVRDPHVQLATALGFGQPLSTAWELTPWSWAIDYFANVSQMLKNLEPRFPGLDLSQEYSTRYFRGSASYSHNDIPWYELGTPQRQIVTIYSFRTMRRYTGIPGYYLEFHKPADLSGQHASYLAAALCQRLK